MIEESQELIGTISNEGDLHGQISPPNGTDDYAGLKNKPQINGITLNGNISLDDIGAVSKEPGKGLSSNDFTDMDKNNVDSNTENRHTHANKSILDSITTNDISKWNSKSDFSGDYEDLDNKPTIPNITQQQILNIDRNTDMLNGKMTIESITADKLECKNKFNKSTIIEDSIIDLDGSVVSGYSGWCASDFIPIKANTKYVYQGITNQGSEKYSAYYDSNKQFISYFRQETGINKRITTPNGAQYIRFSMLTSDKDTFQLELGDYSTEYETYKEIIYDDTFKILESQVEDLENQSIKGSYLGQNPDINTLKTNGIYGLYQCSQAPDTGIGVLEVICYTPDWVIQRFTTIEASPRMWERSFVSGTTWKDWIRRW